jgi:O-antigen/teichoic acid export membrane protein
MKNNSLSTNTLIITLGKSAERIVLLLSTVVLTRYLSQQDYGTYRQVFLIGGTLLLLFSFGIPHSINFFIPQLSKTKQKSFLFQTFLIQLILGLIMFLILLLGSGIIAKIFDNQFLEKPLKLFSLYPLFMILSSSYSNIFIGINRAKLSGLLSPIFGLMKLTAIILCVIFDSSVNMLILINVIFSFFQLVVIISILLKLFASVTLKLNFQDIIDQIKFATPIGLSSLLGVIIIKLDQLMVSSFFDVEEYAKFAVGTLEIPFINLLTISAMAVITPYLVKQYKQERIDLFMQKWKNSIMKISYIIFPITVFFMFFSNETIIILYTEKYIDSAQIFQIYLIKSFVKVTFFGHILVALGKSKQIFYYTLVTLIINILLNLFFIKVFGFIGAAIATVISIFIISLLQLISISKVLEIKFVNIWPWSELALILSISFVSTILVSSMKLIITNEIVLISSSFILFVILYLFLTQYILSKYLPQNLFYKTLIQSLRRKQ